MDTLKPLWRVLFFLIFFVPQASYAGCIDNINDTRLATYCLINSLNGATIDLKTASYIDHSLKNEGFASGLGFNANVPVVTHKSYVVPILGYDSNINGGNADRPLVLNGLSLVGSEQNLKRAGVILGALAGLNGRSIYGEGRYLDYSVSVSYAHSTKHRIGVKRSAASVCSRNLLSDNWYIDGCGDSSRLVRDLAAETKSGMSFSAGKLFAFGRHGFHSTSIGIRRHFADDHTQSQVQLTWDTARPRGVYTSISASFGRPVKDTLAMQQSLVGTLGATVFKRALTATVAYSYASGGRLLGALRNDTSRAISVKYALTEKISLGIGYNSIDSSVDYFDENEPIFSIQFAPIRF